MKKLLHRIHRSALALAVFFIARTITRMGRPQKHVKHPLYKLRVVLSDSATARAITQPELARLVDIPLPTLQSIECRPAGIDKRDSEKDQTDDMGGLG